LNELPASLQTLDCSNNQLKELNELSVSLQTLDCSNNQLTELNKLPASLQTLDCSNNQLKELNELSVSLQTLDCENNQLTELPPKLYLIDVRCNNKVQLFKIGAIRRIIKWYKIKKSIKKTIKTCQLYINSFLCKDLCFLIISYL